MSNAAAGLAHSPIHAKYGPAKVLRWFEIPMRLGQLVPFRHPGGPLLGVLTWARFSEEAEARFLAGEPLVDADWHSGDRLWFIDFLAPFGGAHKMLGTIKRHPFFTDFGTARWGRTLGSGRFQHIGEANRGNYKTPSSPG